jgi:hypothetical protein
MGQRQSYIEQANVNKDKYQKCKIYFNIVNINHFEFMYVIGRGGFGKVIYK